MYAKYEVLIFNGSKVITKVIVDNRQTYKQSNPGQKYAPKHSIRGHKKDTVTAQSHRRYARYWGPLTLHVKIASLTKRRFDTSGTIMCALIAK